MFAIDILVKLVPAFIAVVPLCIKLVKTFYQGNDNMKIVLRSLGLSVLTQFLTLPILTLIMMIVLYFKPNSDNEDIKFSNNDLDYNNFIYINHLPAIKIKL